MIKAKFNITENIQKLSEYAISLSLAGYVAGFIITSIHLGEYGVANFNLIQAHYVLCGVAFLIFAFTCAYPIYSTWRIFEKGKIPRFRDVLKAIFISFIANFFLIASVIAPFALFNNEAKNADIPLEYGTASFLVVLLNSLLAIIFCLLGNLIVRLPEKISSFFFTKKTDNDDIFETHIDFFAPIGISAFLLLFVILLYSFTVYPVLPQQLGGGKEVAVEVSFKQDTLPKTIYLLDRTSDSIVFLSEDCATKEKKAIEVSNDEILSIAPIDASTSICP